MYYSSFGILALIIHIIINIRDMKKCSDEEIRVVDTRYRQFLIGLIFYYTADIFWGFFYGRRMIILAYIDTALFFATMGLTVFFWMRYIVAFLNDDNICTRIITYSGAGIFAFQILALILNIFTPVVYRFDEKLDYVPGKARYIMLFLQVLLFSVVAVYPLFKARKLIRKDRLHHIAAGLSGIVMTIFIILQTLDPLAPLYAIGCLIATCIIHTFVEMDEKEERDRQLGSIRRMAYKDPLTNVKNKRSYDEARAFMDRLIKEGELADFGIIVFDINYLKKVNDTYGHDAGDRYIQKASRLICGTFKHSPVYRIGGDEFAVFLEGEDYRNRAELIGTFNRKVEENIRNGGVVVSAGMDEYDHESDMGFDTIFERADSKMYQRKKKLKSMKQ